MTITAGGNRDADRTYGHLPGPPAMFAPAPRLPMLVGMLVLVLLAARAFPPYHALDHAATYLWLHTAMETLSLTIAAMIFGLCWAAENRHLPRGVTLLSCALLGVALLDFGHLLSYPGMPQFFTPGGTDKAIAFWLAARGLAAFALLGAALAGPRPFAALSSRRWLLAGTLAVTGAAFWAILFRPGWLPAFFVPGSGLTGFKIAAEHTLVAVYLAAAGGFYRQYRKQPGVADSYMLAASIVAALSELWFTAYFSVSDQNNLLGHVYKIIAYLLVYEAVFTHGVQEPYARMDQSQRELHQSEKRFRSLTELSSDWYWEQDAQFRFTQVSGGIRALTDLAPEKLIGKTRWEIPISGLSDERWQAHRAALEARLPFHDLVFQRLNNRGETRWISISGAPFFDENGGFLGYRGVGRDITEQKLAEEKVLLAANVIEQCQEAVVITDAANSIVAVNPAFTRITGYSAAEAIGSNPGRLLRSDRQSAPFYREMWDILKRTGHWKGEVWDRRKNGELYCEWLSIGTVRDAQDNVRQHFAIFTDITARKRDELLLAAEKKHLEMTHTDRPLEQLLDQLCLDLEAVFPGILCSIMLLDGARLRSTAGPSLPAAHRAAMDKLLIGPEAGSCGAAAYLGRRVIVTDIATDPLCAGVRETARISGLRACWSVPIVAGNGKVFGTFAAHLRESRQPGPEEEKALDRATHIAGIAIERKYHADNLSRLNAELERRVAERTAQLEIANKELESFSYSVSHDLRSPLRAIDGFSQILLNDYAAQLDAQGRRHLQSVRKAGEHMGELIDGLLELAQVTRQEFRTDSVDLSEIAGTIAAQLRSEPPLRPGEFRIEDGIVVRGDRRLLHTVLNNLLGNAWKFTAKSPVTNIAVGTLMQDGERVIYVSDNGAGFDMQYAGKLFSAFQRLHHRTEFEGTGIGLATVYRIVSRHGGRIWAESAAGAGATFYFTLPP